MDLTPPRPGELRAGVMAPDEVDELTEQLCTTQLDDMDASDCGDCGNDDYEGDEECVESLEFLEYYSEAFIQRLIDSQVISPRTVMLNYYKYDYDPEVRIEMDVLENFLSYAEQFIEVHDRYTELLEEDIDDYEQHHLSIPFLCSKFADPTRIFQPYVRKFRYTMYTIRYYNYFIQCFLRCHYFENMNDLRKRYAEYEASNDLQNLDSLFEHMSIGMEK